VNISLKSLKFTHHAYCLIGSDSLRLELIPILEKRFKTSSRANVDFFEKKYEVFTIDDAREVKLSHEMMPTDSSGKKFFILSMDGITIEAQNALLKLLEEPSEYAHFFLIIPSAHLLLPTVKSRLEIVDLRDTKTFNSKKNQGADGAVDSKGSKNGSAVNSNVEQDESIKEALQFTAMSVPKRLDFIKSFMVEIDKEKKSKQDAIVFLDALESLVREQKGIKGNLKALEAIEKARDYADDRAPSMKMLLEYVAMNI